MRSAAGRIEALSYWVASDHFEELGPPPRLLHGGFGLQTVGNLPKPRFHALHLLSRLGERELPATIHGDGAGGLVEAWASSADDGRIAILLWNLTLDQAKAAGDPALTRQVRVSVHGIEGERRLRRSRLAPGVGDLAAAVSAFAVTDWPGNEEMWTALAHASQLEVVEATVTGSGILEVDITLEMPSAVLLEFEPIGPAAAAHAGDADADDAAG
jgi:xylan 1,4-beta-xylosidase